MTDPEWTKLLDTLYETDGMLITYAGPQLSHKRKYEVYHPLGDNADLDKHERDKAIEYMESVGLLEGHGSSGHVRLSEEGFRVAHDRAMARRQDNLSAMVGLLTFALVIFSGIQTATQLFPIDGPALEFFRWASPASIAVILAGLFDRVFYGGAGWVRIKDGLRRIH